MLTFFLKQLRDVLLILFIIIFALFIKLKDVQNFSDPENVFSTYDAFRYARFAKEIQAGTYSHIDYLSNAPDFRTNFEPPYLISLLAVWLSGFLNMRLERLFVYLPPVLSLLYIVPLYLWIKTFSDSYKLRYMFAGGAFLGLFNFIYAIRTSPGYFDTDCLILFFIFSIVLFITYAVKEKENTVRSYVYLTVAAIIYRMFLWWYDVYIFAAFFMFSLIAGLITSNHSRKDIVFKGLFFLIVINPSIYAVLWNIKEYATAVFMKQTVNLLPESIFSTINEFKPLSFRQFVAFTTENALTAGLSMAGLVVIVVVFFRHMIILLPFVLIGISAFKSGNRYVMYLAPFLGMGMGYLIYLLFRFIAERCKQKGEFILAAGLLLTVFLSFPPQRIYYSPKPFVSKEMFEGLSSLREVTEKDALIWTWWDWGFVVEYLAERGTYVDGANYHPAKLYFIAKSLMTSEAETAKKAIAFATNNKAADYLRTGTTLQELNERITSYTDSPNRPVYVAVDSSMVDYSFIKKLGLFEIQSDNGTLPLMTQPMSCAYPETVKGIFNCRSMFDFDIGTFEVLPLPAKPDIKDIYREIVFINRDSSTIKKIWYNKRSSSDKTLELIYKHGALYFMIVDNQAKETIFHRMYSLRAKVENFELIMDRFPSLVVYRVIR